MIKLLGSLKTSWQICWTRMGGVSPLQKLKILSLTWKLCDPKFLKKMRRPNVSRVELSRYNMEMKTQNYFIIMWKQEHKLILSRRCLMRMDILLILFINWLILAWPTPDNYSRVLEGPLLQKSLYFPYISLIFLTKMRQLISLRQYQLGSYTSLLNGLERIKSMAQRDGSFKFICIAFRPWERTYLRLWKNAG